MTSELVIETPRLALRRLEKADRAAVAGLDWIDTDRVMRRSVGGGWPYGFLAITDGSGAFLGICGLLEQDLDHGTEVEVGYHLLRSCHGRGVATEAARGVLDYAFDQAGHRRVVSLIRPDNGASRRVAEKNGLRHERDVMFRGSIHGMHVIDRGRWETMS